MPVIVEFVQFALMNRPYPQLSFHGGDEGWSLKECACEGFECSGELSFPAWELVVESNDTDIFLAGTLL